MKINKRIKEIYDEEIPCLRESLKSMSKEERERLYEEHTKCLFPKSKTPVSLEFLLSPRKDYETKFKKTFLHVTNRMMSDYHFGEYNQDYFSKITNTSYVYPQKVVMSLSLLGYVDGLRCNYSFVPDNKEFSHGYIYYINKDKVDGLWSDELMMSDDIGEKPVLSPVYDSSEYQEWFVKKQFETIMSIKVGDDLVEEKRRNDEIIREYNLNRNVRVDESESMEGEEVEDGDYEVLDPVELKIDEPEDEPKNMDPSLSIQEKLTSTPYERYKDYKYRCMDISNLMEKDIETIGTFTIDNYSGRFHSVMTRTGNDIRLSGSLTINGDSLREVDISSSQPTLFGLLVKEEHPYLESEWLNHCLSGDFYEWLVDVTDIKDFNKEKLFGSFNRRELHKLSCSYESDDPYVYLRPVVKSWIMKLLFSSFSIKSMEKNTGSYYKIFTCNLSNYLKEKEPHLYEKLTWYRNPQNQYIENGKRKSQLPKHLQEKEIRYIKECLKAIDPEVEYFYTIHDCVGCCEKDSEKVKEIMEQTSNRMFGVKLNLKIEGENPKLRTELE